MNLQIAFSPALKAFFSFSSLGAKISIPDQSWYSRSQGMCAVQVMVASSRSLKIIVTCSLFSLL